MTAEVRLSRWPGQWQWQSESGSRAFTSTTSTADARAFLVTRINSSGSETLSTGYALPLMPAPAGTLWLLHVRTHPIQRKQLTDCIGLPILGADVLFPVRLGYREVIELSDRLPKPLYCVDGRNVPPPAELESAGVKFVMDNDVFQISAQVVRELLIELRRERFIAGADKRALSWDEFHRVMGTPEAMRRAIEYRMLPRERTQ